MSRKSLTVEEIRERIQEYEEKLQAPDLTPAKRNSVRTYLSILCKRIGETRTTNQEKDPVPEDDDEEQPKKEYIGCVAPARKSRHEMIQDLWKDERKKGC